jgi:hypothetical protein
MGHFCCVMGEIDVVCMAVGMDKRIFDYCGPSGIEVHGGRMLQSQNKEPWGNARIFSCVVILSIEDVARKRSRRKRKRESVRRSLVGPNPVFEIRGRYSILIITTLTSTPGE